jgi:hypothetical protein
MTERASPMMNVDRRVPKSAEESRGSNLQKAL